MARLITEVGKQSRNRRAKVKRTMDRNGATPEGLLRVRLDSRTIITLRGTKALDFWRERYPKLIIL